MRPAHEIPAQHMMVRLDLGTRPLCHNLRAGTDVTERWANPSQPALGARMTFVAQPHTPSNYLTSATITVLLLILSEIIKMFECSMFDGFLK